MRIEDHHEGGALHVYRGGPPGFWGCEVFHEGKGGLGALPRFLKFRCKMVSFKAYLGQINF